jgi:hypothetical protein
VLSRVGDKCPEPVPVVGLDGVVPALRLEGHAGSNLRVGRRGKLRLACDENRGIGKKPVRLLYCEHRHVDVGVANRRV